MTQEDYDALLARINGLTPKVLALKFPAQALGHPTDTSLAIASDNNPVISYHAVNNGDLKVYVCPDTSCVNGTARTLDSAGSVGSYTSIAIGTNGNSVISYHDFTNTTVKVYVCADPACASGTARTLDSTGSVGLYTSIAIGNDNNPFISYVDAENHNLLRYRCQTTDCT